MLWLICIIFYETTYDISCKVDKKLFFTYLFITIRTTQQVGSIIGISDKQIR